MHVPSGGPRGPGFSSLLRQTVLLVALLTALPALATGGAIRVEVVDEDRLPVPHATVTLTGVLLIGGAQVKRTDAEGGVRFDDLPPGHDYTVAVESRSGSARVEPVHAWSEQTHHLLVELQRGDDIGPTESENSPDVVRAKECLQRLPSCGTYHAAVQRAEACLALTERSARERSTRRRKRPHRP